MLPQRVSACGFCFSCAGSLDIRELQSVLLSAITSVDMLTIRRSRFHNIFTVLCFVILFAALSKTASAGSLEEGGRSLARQVVSSLHGAAVTYEQHNLPRLARRSFSIWIPPFAMSSNVAESKSCRVKLPRPWCSQFQQILRATWGLRKSFGRDTPKLSLNRLEV